MTPVEGQRSRKSIDVHVLKGIEVKTMSALKSLVRIVFLTNSGSGVARQTQPKKGQFMNFSQGHSRTKAQCESCLFSQGKTPEFTELGEIHELFVFALSLVWFARATPDLDPSRGENTRTFHDFLLISEELPSFHALLWGFQGYTALVGQDKPLSAQIRDEREYHHCKTGTRPFAIRP